MREHASPLGAFGDGALQFLAQELADVHLVDRAGTLAERRLRFLHRRNGFDQVVLDVEQLFLDERVFFVFQRRFKTVQRRRNFLRVCARFETNFLLGLYLARFFIDDSVSIGVQNRNVLLDAARQTFAQLTHLRQKPRIAGVKFRQPVDVVERRLDIDHVAGRAGFAIQRLRPTFAYRFGQFALLRRALDLFQFRHAPGFLHVLAGQRSGRLDCRRLLAHSGDARQPDVGGCLREGRTDAGDDLGLR